MITRRALLRAGSVLLAATSLRPSSGFAAEMPGVAAESIKIGQTMPYSGPASAYGVIGRSQVAYFKMINEKGGINGRRIDLVSLDDGYSPPKAVEQIRRLVEQDKVAFIFASLGTPSNMAIRPYLNERKIPQLFAYSGTSKLADPRFPWTMGGIQNYYSEGTIYASHILASAPNARIAVLYQNDDLGKDYLSGLKAGLGSDHAGMIVKEASYEVSDPTVDSQIVSLEASDADTLVIFAIPKFAAQAVRKSYDLGWKGTRYLAAVGNSVGVVMKPAGLQKGVGIISAGAIKDPSDPRWKDDAGYRRWLAFMQRYMPGADLTDIFYPIGYNGAQAMARVLEMCGNGLSRENILHQAQSLKDFEADMLLPGIRMNGRPDNTAPIRQMQLHRFTGQTWRPFGDILNG